MQKNFKPAKVRGDTYYPVLSGSRQVRHGCGGYLYHAGRNGWRWCSECKGYVPWPGEKAEDNQKEN